MVHNFYKPLIIKNIIHSLDAINYIIKQLILQVKIEYSKSNAQFLLNV